VAGAPGSAWANRSNSGRLVMDYPTLKGTEVNATLARRVPVWRQPNHLQAGAGAAPHQACLHRNSYPTQALVRSPHSQHVSSMPKA
jgi:hypothetical protein